MVQTYFRFEVTQQRRCQRTHTLTIPTGGTKKRERVENVEHCSLPVQKWIDSRDIITNQATYPIPYRVLNMTCPLIVRGTSRSIWISYDEGMSILSCCPNPPINTFFRLYLTTRTHPILYSKGP